MRKTPIQMTKKNAIKLMSGDNLELLKKMPDNCVDAIVSDPPYALNFMGKKWDSDVPSVEFWKEVYRVLKPGGHVLSFGGTRTYHRMTVNIEDAGFEIRDQIMWLYGSGFPKSQNISKAFDKKEGVDMPIGKSFSSSKDRMVLKSTPQGEEREAMRHIPTNSNAKKWEGWGTALKPANEPICVARKPLSEKTIVDNVIKWGTGGINIDGCRVDMKEGDKKVGGFGNAGIGYGDVEGEKEYKGEWVERQEGRFPANVILECICEELVTAPAPKSGHWPKGKTKGFGEFGNGESTYEGVGPKESGTIAIHTDPNCPCRLLDEQSGVSKSTPMKESIRKENILGKETNSKKDIYAAGAPKSGHSHSDKGGASRFFYCAKVSKKERNAGLDGFELASKNNHPTVKPIALMAYLCRLVTPPQGLVLDPFMGSGSTGCAAIQEGFRFAGMELDPDYFEIAKARIEHYYKKTYENGNDE